MKNIKVALKLKKDKSNLIASNIIASLSSIKSYHRKDDLLTGITFEDLITTVQSNEPNPNSKAVLRVFNEMLSQVVADAEHELKTNMKNILKEL